MMVFSDTRSLLRVFYSFHFSHIIVVHCNILDISQTVESTDRYANGLCSSFWSNLSDLSFEFQLKSSGDLSGEMFNADAFTEEQDEIDETALTNLR